MLEKGFSKQETNGCERLGITKILSITTALDRIFNYEKAMLATFARRANEQDVYTMFQAEGK